MLWIDEGMRSGQQDAAILTDSTDAIVRSHAGATASTASAGRVPMKTLIAGLLVANAAVVVSSVLLLVCVVSYG